MPQLPQDHAPPLDAEAVRAALAAVHYPGLSRDIVSFGMVEQVVVCGTQVKVRLGVRTSDPAIAPQLTSAVQAAVRDAGGTHIEVEVGLPEARPRPALRGTPDPWGDQVRLGRVRHVIAVGAGKGGVGKSTIAVNLALALAQEGMSVGLLDADIYGPSLPTLLGITDGNARVSMTPEKHIVPVMAHGVPLISFGFFLGEESPAIWRGPMVSKAVKQFARGVDWPALDVLVVDLPPGTGDVPLSLAQAVEVSGGIVVTQPQWLAGSEAQKAGQMFRELQVPVVGVVENMTGAYGWGAGGVVAHRLGAPLLGTVAFDAQMVGEGDSGTPTVLARPTSDAAESFRTIARAVAEALP
ncbi:MAG TPA: P-loop NTPase [Gemmatimonadaceae bacterium]|nr:P-loop NTPase [Gemmatimonadaceae bacterium]